MWTVQAVSVFVSTIYDVILPASITEIKAFGGKSAAFKPIFEQCPWVDLVLPGLSRAAAEKCENFTELKNSIHYEIKKIFDEEGIEIPFPHVSLYTGSATEPFPVRVVERDADN